MHVCFQNTNYELLKNNIDFISYDSPGRISLLLKSVTDKNILYILDQMDRVLETICH